MQSTHDEASQKKFGLTPGELEIVSAVVAGYSNREIADYFKIGEHRVLQRLANSFDKLGVSTRLELALFAVNQALPLKSIEGPQPRLHIPRTNPRHSDRRPYRRSRNSALQKSMVGITSRLRSNSPAGVLSANASLQQLSVR